MSRTGVEQKPPWREVPDFVRSGVESALGAKVARGCRIWGGYSPTPTFRLRLTDGRRAFFKGVNPDCTEFARVAMEFEARVYADLGFVLAGWAPEFYALFATEDWKVILLEDLGPKTVPPWTLRSARQITQELARFHQSTVEDAFPDWLPTFGSILHAARWDKVDPPDPAVADWLALAVPHLAPLVDSASEIDTGYCLIHGDLRSDNLRYNQGQLRFFDLPAVFFGPPEWEVIAFAQSVSLESGILPETIVEWYSQVSPLREEVVSASIAWWVAFFAQRAWEPDIPGLPRLRPFQRHQLDVLSRWAARRFYLSVPGWEEFG